jgi:ligand-binding SRPBCC domain-containing protein
MTDEVRYLPPFEPFGRLALPLIRWQLDRIFRFRGEAIRAVFPDEARRSS